MLGPWGAVFPAGQGQATCPVSPPGVVSRCREEGRAGQAHGSRAHGALLFITGGGGRAMEPPRQPRDAPSAPEAFSAPL